MDRGAWQATVHGITNSQTQLNKGAHTHTSLFRHMNKLSNTLKSKKTRMEKAETLLTGVI